MYTYFNCCDSAQNLDKCDVEEIKICFGNQNIYSTEHKCKRINGHTYQTNLIATELHVLINRARNLWRQVEDLVLTDGSNQTLDIFTIRNQIVDLLAVCRYAVLTCKSESHNDKQKLVISQLIQLLKKSIFPIHEFESSALNKIVSSSASSAETSIYQYLHMYLDAQWLILNLEYICKAPWETVQDTIKRIIQDLLCISRTRYLKNTHISAITLSAFNCQCVKQLWALLKLFCEKYFEDPNEFWNLYNDGTKSQEEVFSIWMLSNLATLKSYVEEGSQEYFPTDKRYDNSAEVNRKLKSLLSKTMGYPNEMLKRFLEVLYSLMSTYWLDFAKIETYQILWDYFYKHLTEIDLKPVRSVGSFMEILHRIWQGHQKSTYNSFEWFLSLLVVHLRKHPSHWSKLRGRIYSRLTIQKVKDFNEKGLYNISLLFMVLAKVNFDEMTTKLNEILNSLPQEKKNTEFIWITHMSMACLSIENSKKMTPTTLLLVEDSMDNRDRYYLLKLYIEGVDYILNANDDLKLNQTSLFGTWLIKYMQTCQHSDLCYLLNILTCLVERTQKKEIWFEWSCIFTTITLPALKQISVSPSAPPQTGKLAAMIVLNLPELVNQYLLYFTSDVVPAKVSTQFLNVLLEEFPENRIITINQEEIIIKAWIRSNIFTMESNEDLAKKITKFNMLSLLEFTDFGADPFVSFVKALGLQVFSTTSNLRVKELCEVSFGQLDRSLTTFLASSNSESCTLHVYNSIAVLVYHCSSILYHRTKSNCLLSRIINAALLPTEVLMGKNPHIFVLRALEKTWHLFFQGVFKLDYVSDPYLERTLRDLISRYLPHFTPSESPILKCLESTKAFNFILDKITNTFLSRSAKTTEENTFKALRTVHCILENCDDLNRIQLVVQRVLPAILEVVMFQHNKGAAVEILKVLAVSDWYVHVREDIKKAILSTTEKHLAFSTSNFFQLAFTLIKLVPVDMKDLLPSIKKQIVVVERMRGVGYDNTLRQGLDRIEAALSS